MSAAATQTPVVPPRPSRGQEKASTPVIPPRPTKSRIELSMSPNPDRFAPSPLNKICPTGKPPHGSNLSLVEGNGEPLSRSTSVDLPSVGEEGQEYARLAEQMSTSAPQNIGPEHTSTVASDLKLHAPKPSLPAVSAKQRVLAVTRTDSDRAASFGIGRPSSVPDDHTPARSLKKKASTTSQLSNTTERSHPEDEHGIPEIGQQVPMFPNAGDVQAPSPAPGAVEPSKGRNHTRKTSSRGILPPGSYGLHGHGVVPQDKLEKAYYEKHPEELKKEIVHHHHDRANDFSMSSDDLNKIVRETASRGNGLAVQNFPGTPSEEIGWQAMEESTSRVASPRPKSTEIKCADMKSPLKQVFTPEETAKPENRGPLEGEVIHVDEPGHRKSVVFSDADLSSLDDTPILAEDEVAKAPSTDNHPAVELPPERSGSAFEMDEKNSRPSSTRPASRPSSVYKDSSFELRSTPLEDVEEYEPLFPEDEKTAGAPKQPSPEAWKEKKQRFPSQDVWEDAPSSVHYTAEVSTPDFHDTEGPATSEPAGVIPPPRDNETPAQAFARHQEELAEKEAREHGPDGFIPSRNGRKPLWPQHQAHLAPETNKSGSRPALSYKFPSRDVWEDTPDSLKLETTVSTPQQDKEAAESPDDSSKPEVPQRPQRKAASPDSSECKDKPAIPERPKPKQTPSDDASSKPVVTDRPKPQIPARPAKAGPASGGLEPAEAAAPPPKAKPAVPVRPMGSKIAALQAGFMSDLNNRLRLGPQAPKKEESKEEEAPVEDKEKQPLSDARKGRARGPQRRAPAAKNPSSAVAAAPFVEKSAVTFSFSVVSTVWEIDPEDGDLSVGHEEAESKTELAAEEAPASKEDMEFGAVEEAKRATEEAEKQSQEPEVKEEVKTLATNMAGEPVVEEHEKKDEKAEKLETEVVEH